MLSAEVLLFLPTITLFSIIASHSDIVSRKIPNALIKRMLVVSVLLNAFYLAANHGTPRVVGYVAFVLVSAVAALVLWLLDFWKPGDVKFYVALSTFMHPTKAANFLLPILVFIILSFVVTILESLMTRKIKFQPKLDFGLFLPIILVPVMPFLGISAFPLMFFLYFIGKKFKSAKIPLSFLVVISFFVSPSQAVKIFAATLAFSLAASVKFEGHLPSAPFIAISFIYSLIFDKL